MKPVLVTLFPLLTRKQYVMAKLKERHPEVQLEKREKSAILKPRNKVSFILRHFMAHSFGKLVG